MQRRALGFTTQQGRTFSLNAVQAFDGLTSDYEAERTWTSTDSQDARMPAREIEMMSREEEDVKVITKVTS